MKLSQILILAVSTALFSVTPASAAMLTHEDGVTYEDIKSCLEDLGMEEKEHFRNHPSIPGRVQMNRAALHSFLLTQSVSEDEVRNCWKKQPSN